MIRGLIIGKFAPLHKGHEMLIEKALNEVDELLIMVYDAPDQTKISLKCRSNWIKFLYPSVEIILADKVPKDKGYTEAIQNKHIQYILSLLENKKIHKLFSSEDYGEKMSKALQCENRLIDKERIEIPITGTLIRSNPEKYKAYLSPHVFEAIIQQGDLEI